MCHCPGTGAFRQEVPLKYEVQYLSEQIEPSSIISNCWSGTIKPSESEELGTRSRNMVPPGSPSGLSTQLTGSDVKPSTNAPGCWLMGMCFTFTPHEYFSLSPWTHISLTKMTSSLNGRCYLLPQCLMEKQELLHGCRYCETTELSI